MKLLALDLARKTGWAYGIAGQRPRSGVEEVRPTSLDIEHGAGGIARFVRDLCYLADSRPDLIVFEAPMPIFNDTDERGERTVKRSPDSLAQPPMLVGAVVGLAACYGIDWRKAHPATWRKHFLGRSNFGSSDATKRAVVERCRVLGYIGRDRVITNQKADKLFDECDALGLWDFASAKFGRAAPAELKLFGERVPA
jgi:hypothetical protein